jgi:lipoprotein-releasing system ATP-binding protein
MLSTKDIRKNYGNLSILKGIQMDVQPKEIVSIVGASGAGKTTLLHILGTLDKPDQGELIIRNIRVFDLSARKLSAFRNLHIGFVFQFHHLLPEFSALENVSMPAWIANRSKKETQAQAEQLLDRLGLRDRMHHKPQELSGGEQQRVAIARALINKPAVVLADEPTGNLDIDNSKIIFTLINELRHEYNQTFILVTHQEELANLSDRKFTIANGLIQA